MWQQVCKPNWQRYAEKYHLDLICLSQPLIVLWIIQQAIDLMDDPLVIGPDRDAGLGQHASGRAVFSRVISSGLPRMGASS
jgi:hypothetical protein